VVFDAAVCELLQRLLRSHGETASLQVCALGVMALSWNAPPPTLVGENQDDASP
jgi:hypothetical protein